MDRIISKRQYELLKLVCSVFNNHQVEQEYSLGSGLRIDIFIHNLDVAIEYQSSIHFSPNKFMHQNQEGWQRAQENDKRKRDICEQKGYAFVEFFDHDVLDEKLVLERVLLGIEKACPLTEKQKVKDSWNDLIKEKKREERKRFYQKVKKLRKGRDELEKNS